MLLEDRETVLVAPAASSMVPVAPEGPELVEDMTVAVLVLVIIWGALALVTAVCVVLVVVVKTVEWTGNVLAEEMELETKLKAIVVATVAVSILLLVTTDVPVSRVKAVETTLGDLGAKALLVLSKLSWTRVLTSQVVIRLLDDMVTTFVTGTQGLTLFTFFTFFLPVLTGDREELWS